MGVIEKASIDCYAYGSPLAGGTAVGARYVYITMPKEFDVGHPYTMIASQGTPAPT